MPLWGYYLIFYGADVVAMALKPAMGVSVIRVSVIKAFVYL